MTKKTKTKAKTKQKRSKNNTYSYVTLDDGSKVKITAKQKAFCEYFLETGNGAEAARKAGYAKKTSNRIAAENMTKPVIKKYLEGRIEKADENRIAKVDEVLEFFTSVMRGEVKDQFDLDPALTERIKAGELLGRRYSAFTDKVKVEGVQQVVINDDIPLVDDEND